MILSLLTFLLYNTISLFVIILIIMPKYKHTNKFLHNTLAIDFSWKQDLWTWNNKIKHQQNKTKIKLIKTLNNHPTFNNSIFEKKIAVCPRSIQSLKRSEKKPLISQIFWLIEKCKQTPETDKLIRNLLIKMIFDFPDKYDKIYEFWQKQSNKKLERKNTINDFFRYNNEYINLDFINQNTNEMIKLFDTMKSRLKKNTQYNEKNDPNQYKRIHTTYTYFARQLEEYTILYGKETILSLFQSFIQTKDRQKQEINLKKIIIKKIIDKKKQKRDLPTISSWYEHIKSALSHSIIMTE